MEPRDAATLILLRDRREVLMGARDPRHVFMPHMFVFPGGGVDAGDADLHVIQQLPPCSMQALQRSTSLAQARALALTAIRETWEETGLCVGHLDSQDAPPAALPHNWQGYFARGISPALDQMHYIARAITPEGAPRRFDARFFLLDARHAHGQLAGSGELHDLDWYPLNEALSLPLGSITELVLRVVKARLDGSPVESIPLYRALQGSELIEHHWPAALG